MAVQALYRKWRPRTFDEVVGQEHIVRTLRNALTSGRIHHAYLFTGPRGTGKTTTARLLAKAVNCLAPEDQRPCNECVICQAVNEGRLLDLIEIDAASNTGVDDVRELRQRVGFRPNEARYKVYVIDEVHMLSNAAFNALLKTLEEPPPHAIFVLATTEPHKIPATVLSRCQRFDFRRIPVSKIVARLEWLIEQEHIPADREALTLVARQSTGSMRDAESLLDQLASYDDSGITVGEVRAALGTGDSEAIIQVADALAKGDVAQGLSAINTAVDEGADPRQFARQMVEHLRALLLLRLKSGVMPIHVSEDLRPQLEKQAAAFPPRALARAVRLFSQAAVEARGGWQPQLPLEMAFIEAMLSPEPESPVSNEGSAPAGSRTPPAARHSTPSASPSRLRHETSASPRPEAWPEGSGGPTSASPRPEGSVGPTLASPRPEGSVETRSAGRSAPVHSASPPPPPPPQSRPKTVQEPASAYDLAPGDGSVTSETLRGRWSELLEALRLDKQNLPLEALMRSCKPVAVEGDVIVLGFDYDLHRGRVEEEQNKRDVEEVLSNLTGQRYRVRCVLAQQDGASGTSHRSMPHSTAGKATSSVEQIIAEDPVVRTAVEDLGAQIVRRHE